MDSAAVVTPPYVATPLQLRPFTALMLSPSRVGDPASARAFARPYRAVARRLDQWQARGHLVRDVAPALYLHEYTSGGLTVRGLVGALDISRRAKGLDDRAVWPHEGIHPEQVAELATRMREMAMNPAPILLAHRGPRRLRDLLTRVSAAGPAWQYTDRAGQRQRLWRVHDPADLSEVDDSLADAHVLLADGHHRYAAYLQLQHLNPGTAWDRGLAMLVDQDDTPLFLGAIHRTLHGTTLAALRGAAAALGAEVADQGRDRALRALAPGSLVVTDGHEWLVVRRTRDDRTQVEWLHQVLLPALALQHEGPTAPTAPTVEYHHTVDDALDAAGGGLAVLLPAPDFDQVQGTLARDRLLPQKATSFQPKPSLGVLIRSLRDE